MLVGGYAAHLYCDSGADQPYADEHHNRIEGHHNHPGAYDGRSEADCVRQATRDGWRITRAGYVLCPRCAAQGITRPRRMR